MSALNAKMDAMPIKPRLRRRLLIGTGLAGCNAWNAAIIATVAIGAIHQPGYIPTFSM